MSSFQIKCPNCDAGLQWSPEHDTVRCDYCQSQFTVAEVEAYNSKALAQQNYRQFAAPSSQTAAQEATVGLGAESNAGSETAAGAPLQTYHCASCGAEVVTDDSTLTTFCYYCHNPVLLVDRMQADFKPEQIIPFQISKAKAQEQFLLWAKQKRFVPRAFYSQAQLEKITGLYLPYYFAYGQVQLALAGLAYLERRWTDAQQEYTETKVFNLERQGALRLDNLAELAYDKTNLIDPALILSVANYDEAALRPFALSYLAGYFAETRTLAEADLRPRFAQRMQAYGEAAVAEVLAPYSRTELQQEDVEPELEELRYTLLPAWVLCFKYGGKTYTYALNGQTGEAFGELPVDRNKLSLWSALLALALVLLLLLGGKFLW